MSNQVFQLVDSIYLEDGRTVTRVLATFATKEGAQKRRRAILAKAQAAEIRRARSWLTKSRRGLRAHPDSPALRSFFARKRAIFENPKLGPIQKLKAEGEALGIAWNQADFASEVRDAQAYLTRVSDFETYLRSNQEPRIRAVTLKD